VKPNNGRGELLRLRCDLDSSCQSEEIRVPLFWNKERTSGDLNSLSHTNAGRRSHLHIYPSVLSNPNWKLHIILTLIGKTEINLKGGWSRSWSSSEMRFL